METEIHKIVHGNVILLHISVTLTARNVNRFVTHAHNMTFPGQRHIGVAHVCFGVCVLSFTDWTGFDKPGVFVVEII